VTCEPNDGAQDCPEPDDESNAITFGWIIANDSQAQPIQKSQLVLVSVPAYLDRLDISVETAWLESDGTTEHGLVSYKMPTVRVPPDFEAFDTLVDQDERRHGPAIFKSFMGKEMVRACGPAEIVIPGARLWRSATVTIGDQAADKITVLPNMQGLLATFNEVHVPSSRETDKESLVSLKVWTSEGVDTENSKVHVLVPPDGVCPPPRAADAGNGSTE
jgi:hypothetical protein